LPHFDTGKIVWQREPTRDYPAAAHPRNSYASETPICDGERVYVYFADIGVFCYDLDGKPLWEKRWESYPTRGGWRTGASPALHKDRLYIVNDNEKESFMVALDRATGKQLWRVERAEKSNWATPYVWENEERTEIVTIGRGGRVPHLRQCWELAGTWPGQPDSDVQARCCIRPATTTDRSTPSARARRTTSASKTARRATSGSPGRSRAARAFIPAT
jgi:hypothetical protein